jgi:hypothetical protein
MRTANRRSRRCFDSIFLDSETKIAWEMASRIESRESAHARWAFLNHPLLFWTRRRYAMTRPYQLPSGMAWGGNSWW